MDDQNRESWSTADRLIDVHGVDEDRITERCKDLRSAGAESAASRRVGFDPGSLTLRSWF